MPRNRITWCVVLLCSVFGLCAQVPDVTYPLGGADRRSTTILGPLTSDRPGFSDGVNILSTGVFQLESGFSFSGRREGISADRTFIGGSPLLRMGLGHRLELRFGGDGFRSYSHRAGPESDRAAGASDFSAGAKFALVSDHGFHPALTLISMTSLPVGNRRFTSSGIDPTLKLAWSKSLGEETAVSGNFSVSSLTDSNSRFWQQAATVQLSRSVWRRLSGFWELYVASPGSRGGNRVWTFDMGASHPLGRDTQLDVSVGQQIVPLARCWFVAAGVAVRRPLWSFRRH